MKKIALLSVFALTLLLLMNQAFAFGDDTGAECYEVCDSQSCGKPCTFGGQWQTCDGRINWVHADYRKVGGQGDEDLLCHVDIDTHLFDVDLEFYAVDRYRDHSCAEREDRWKKTYRGKISCSHMTLFNDWVSGGFDAPGMEHGDCAGRSFAFIQTRNLTPVFTTQDQDQCPTPRL